MRSLGIIKLIVVMSPRVWTKWQTPQGPAIAECTDLPRLLSAWQEEQLSSLGIAPGCSTAIAPPPVSSRTAKAAIFRSFISHSRANGRKSTEVPCRKAVPQIDYDLLHGALLHRTTHLAIEVSLARLLSRHNPGCGICTLAAGGSPCASKFGGSS